MDILSVVKMKLNKKYLITDLFQVHLLFMLIFLLILVVFMNIQLEVLLEVMLLKLLVGELMKPVEKTIG